MKEYFYNTISECFGNAIYTMYGSVAVVLHCSNDDKAIRYIAYDLPSEVINEFSVEERKKHIKVDKSFDISDVNFNEKMSVLQKINDLVTSFEMEVYSA
ncbi:hypothetical protein [Siminovitchia fordii]|uniref:Uncharacterized protein n=1 Tax=Siminovitchia fordii TaxID=254759 RepID=A0ABQ4K6R6_9BACI|nr:hypothetical protein [Siminovitchia fordii]GIN21434.1 hypothetical protein J1TS3_25680 [Siminovitchia fordii]